MRSTKVAFATFACAILAVIGTLAPPLLAQTTGRLVGTIEDAQGAVLPGVTVTATSPQLQGASTAITDANGQFRFPALPPGAYHVKAELAGFKTVENDVNIYLDQTRTVPIKMSVAGVAETVNVVGVTPVVDTTSTTSGITAGAEVFNNLPVKRDFYAISRIAPGVTQDTYGAAVSGSTSAENQYIIDGLNTTGVERGTQGKTLNFDFIQEVEVKTGGMPAEYGRMTGGAVNVVTKSGGNVFHGDGFGFFEHSQASSIANQVPQTSTTTTTTPKTADYGVDLGGFIVKDKLWFFGAFDRVQRSDERTIIRTLTSPGSPSVGSVVPLQRDSNLFAAKLTLKASQNHTLIFSTFGDPETRNGYQFAIAGPPSTWDGTLDRGGVDTIGRYEGVYGSRTMLQVQAALHKEKNLLVGAGASTPQLIDQTVSPNQASGGFSGFDNTRFSRPVVKGDLTQYMGSHTMKLGGDWERPDANVDRYQGGGGQRIYKLRQASTGIIYYRHRYYVNDQAAGYDRLVPTTWQIANPLTAQPRTVNNSFYAQDSYKVAGGFSLNYGVRWESQEVQDRGHAAAFKLSNNWAPRLGFVWDPTNTGKAKIYANWGRFYENIPMDINIQAFGGEATAFSYNFSPNPADTLPVASAPTKSTLLGGSAEPVDPNLKGQYVDEVLGGFEYEVMPNTTFGFRLTHRNLGRAIEDFLVPAEGEYFIANPGEGTLGKTLAFYDGVSSAPAPAANRKYTSAELSLRKRYRENWQLLGSYVWSHLEGNYDGTFQASTGQLDPNINSAFDYADFTVNAQGALSGQREHQVKMDGSYTVSKGIANGLNFGGSFHWYSGTPLTAYGYSFGYANWEYYLTPRGSLGNGPSDWESDIHIGYPVKVGGQARANIMLDMFNVFNRQGINQLDQRYNLVQDGACGGVPSAICNGDGGLLAKPGTTDPVSQLTNARATATNPDFLKAAADSASATLPRAIRFGIRVSF
jgi:hypothetical protein